MKNERELRSDIVEVCKHIHAKGWISSTDGNVSARLRHDRILITPSGIHKGFMKTGDLIIVDNKGGHVSGKGKPSSEMMMHITCYDERPDIGAVVHAHPTLSVAFSVAGVKLAKCLLPEVVFTLGSIPTADYAPPATDEVPDSIKKYIKDFDAVILERHGSVTVGSDVFTAYNALERMEHVAEITYHARQLGSVEPLSGKQIARLQEIGEEQGWPKRKIIHDSCNECNACNKFSPQRNQTPVDPGCDNRGQVAKTMITNPSEEVMNMIVNEVVASMKS
ncbi:Ribulose-5-phosphate 4-epimerase and related epimerases and aldolases [hydrothermal vent metagenome]|uniref:Ribulose-5-phosphate 4-epimerase and related epimerases and aldolases n=1 Tax=hydrothermal vent metagenome TaxID=652676 RepID=A0A3B1C531_9ZZZZ